MAADVEKKALVIDSAADAADISRITLDDRHVAAGFGEHIGGGQTGGPRPDDENIGTLQLTCSAGRTPAE